jgi:glycerol-3-phosphate dehydrogenase (NAD(P)+)
MAIAVGAADGLGFGHNARAGLITRGLAEITRLAVRKGANPLTLQGLAGMGDLVLTCTGDLSRNRTVGLRLGRGETIEQILGSMSAVAEGVLTSRSAHRLAESLGVDAPIIAHTYRALHEGLAPRAALEGLMSRPLKDELVL